MTSSLVTLDRAVGDIETLDSREWRARVLDGLAAGEHLLTLYGRADGDAVLVTAVTEAHDRATNVLRTRVAPDVGYHALTTDVPAAHCFERELHEQLGVRVAGHPWLKPIRFERGDQDSMREYPFYRIEGKEVHEVAVGPIHAGVIEPGSFRFSCLGERVLHLEIHLGYQHRGVEALLLRHPPKRLAPWVETLAGDTTIAHTWAYCAAIEQLVGSSLDPRTDLVRGVLLELERVGMHLSSLSGMAGDIGYQPGASTYGRLRTTAINTTMRLCGSRFGRGGVRPGTSAIVTSELAAEARANLALIGRDVAEIDECFSAARSVQHRLKGVGVITAAVARELGLVGLVARASGCERDTRSARRGIYATAPVASCTEASGDCWARAQLRIAELRASLDWLRRVLEVPLEVPSPATASGDLAPSRLVVAVAEGWRGEVVHCLETGPDGGLLHYKVQDPSLRNWMGLAMAVRENDISDFPICNKSFDLSYCGNDL